MQALTEFAPLLAFAAAYFLRGLYVATAVLMVAMLALLAVDWLRTRRIPPLHALSTVLVLIFGGATLALHDRVFIQWKPTVFFWLASLAFLGSSWIGKRTLTERLLGGVLTEAFGARLHIGAPLWRRLNLLWALFYFVLGALNVVVLRTLSEAAWVALKLVDLVLMLLFVAGQVLWLAARAARPGAEAPQHGAGSGGEAVVAQLRASLERAFAPSTLEIIDDGARHVGHASAGRGHFRVLIVSEAFRGRAALERHRLVYAALTPLLESSVHALNITARTADERP